MNNNNNSIYLKGRQNTQNPDKESVLLDKQDVQKVSSTEFLMKKDASKSVSESMKERMSRTEDIFIIESEHKRLSESLNGKESPGLSPTNDAFFSEKVFSKSPVTKIRSVSRLSSGAINSIQNGNSINGYRYNPVESPSASLFSSQLKDSIPTEPAKYVAKHEEVHENNLTKNNYRTLEPLAVVDGMDY